MRSRIKGAIVASGAAAGLAVFSLAVIPIEGQAPATYKATRSAFKDGKPDLNGIWQANNTANWDIQGHAARQGRSSSSAPPSAFPPGWAWWRATKSRTSRGPRRKRRRTLRTG